MAETESGDARLETWKRRAVATAYWAGIALCFCLYASAGPRFQPWMPLLAIALSSFIVTLVHEAGHAIAAWAVGWRVLVIAAGPFALHIPNRSLGWMRLDSERDVGGFVAAVPCRPETATRKAYAIHVAAGGIANLLFFVGLLAVALSWPADPPYALQTNRLWLALALHSLFVAAFNLYARGGSDGKTLAGLFRESPRWGDDPEWRRARAPIWIAALNKYKVRLRDLPQWMLDELRGSPHVEVQNYLQGLEVGRALDAAQPDAVHARQLIEAHRERWGDSLWLSCCETYLAVIWERRPEPLAAPPWQQEADYGLAPLWFAVSAAIAARQGDRSKVRALLRKMREALRENSPYRDDTFRDIAWHVRNMLRETLAAQARERTISQPMRASG